MSNSLKSMFIAAVIVIGGIGAFIFHKTEPHKMYICIGAVLFIVGLILLFSQKLTMNNIYMPLLPFCGVMMIITESLMLYGESVDGADTKVVIGMLGLDCFYSGAVLAGIYLIVVPHFIHKKNMKIFTLPVDAVCVKLNVRRSRHASYAPVWEYDCNGYKYTNEESKYKFFNFVKVGQVYKLLLNPDNPKEFYRIVKSERIFQIIIGSVFTVMGIILLVNFNIR